VDDVDDTVDNVVVVTPRRPGASPTPSGPYVAPIRSAIPEKFWTHLPSYYLDAAVVSNYADEVILSYDVTAVHPRLGQD